MQNDCAVFVAHRHAATRAEAIAAAHALARRAVQFESCADFLAGYDGHLGGCLVLADRCGELTAAAVLDELWRTDRALASVVLAPGGDITLAVEVLQRGAVDVIERWSEPDRLVAAVRDALSADARVRSQLDRQRTLAARFASLTQQESHVVTLLCRGESNRGIAEQLDISLRTVLFRRAAIERKLGVRSVPGLLDLLAQQRELSRLNASRRRYLNQFAPPAAVPALLESAAGLLPTTVAAL